MEKKKPQKEEKDESTARLQGIYRKKCEQNGLTQIKLFKERIEAVAEQGKLQTLQMWEEMGPVNVRAIMDTFSEISYKHLKTIRLWKVRTEDEGVRAICNYIEKAQTIEYLDLLDNDITPLGCEFLGKVLGAGSPIVKLKLDHNCFGTDGLRNLTVGLSKNSTIEKLSLKYCKLNEHSSRYLQDILANINTKMKSVKLQGNPLKNEGVFQLLRAVEFNESLEKLKIPDVQMSVIGDEHNKAEEEKVSKKLLEVVESNKNIHTYDFRFNQLSDEGKNVAYAVARQLVARVQANTSIVKMQMSQTVAQEIREMLSQSVKKRKVGKKGKKKKSGSLSKKKKA